MYLLGYDIGSSSVKAALIHAQTGEKVAAVQSPDSEMEILAPQPDQAEQDPEMWWHHVCAATRKILSQTGIAPEAIGSIGISYQMHGLVLVDKHKQVLRPAIIWCDSRAVGIGQKAFEEIGPEKCLEHALNSPGNFTASKLKWVKENEPDVYQRIDKIMLPGDYIAMKLTDDICTTAGGLSEGILWDFKTDSVADFVLDYFGIDAGVIPAVVPNFTIQGRLTMEAAQATGLAIGTPVTYRSGDQPNNALSLNVLSPGEIAATGGTSGVVYGVVDRAVYDPQSRVNGFAHVNHSAENPRIGVLLCINGTGIQYNWVRQQIAQDGLSYNDLEVLAATIAPGADGLRVFPFGNGAERMLENQNPGARVSNLHFNRHTRAHLYRAALEGIAFSFVYGMEIMASMGLNMQVIRVGNDNLFQSAVFSNTISSLTNSRIEVLETNGAAGAAKASGVGIGASKTIEEAMQGVRLVRCFEPVPDAGLRRSWEAWRAELVGSL